MTLILSGALHGLVLLPVVLSIAGGPGFTQQEADEEWMSNAIRNDYEYTYVTVVPVTYLLTSIPAHSLLTTMPIRPMIDGNILILRGQFLLLLF